jgi:hypothetical protein
MSRRDTRRAWIPCRRCVTSEAASLWTHERRAEARRVHNECGDHQDKRLIGREPQNTHSGRLRGFTYKIVRDSPCPVVSILRANARWFQHEASVLHAAPFWAGRRICQPGDNLVSPAVSIGWTKLCLDRTLNGCSFPAAEVIGNAFDAARFGSIIHNRRSTRVDSRGGQSES